MCTYMCLDTYISYAYIGIKTHIGMRYIGIKRYVGIKVCRYQGTPTAAWCL